jgi:carboxymethylenebutenolidase
MCFDLDSHPPVAPIAGAAVSHEDLVLRSADGTGFAAFAAVPDGPAEAAGVVLLPDVRGLYGFYEELALRLAERGHPTVTFDYFGRTAGASKRGDDFDSMPHVKQVVSAHVRDDVAACIAHLRSLGARSVIAVGFCFGGRHAWLAAADGHALAGAVGFYGSLGERNGEPGPLARAGEIEAPILALMAGDDHAVTPDQVEAFDAALASAGTEHEVVTYPGAPHSFFDRKQEQFAAESADAWDRTLAFLGAHG